MEKPGNAHGEMTCWELVPAGTPHTQLNLGGGKCVSVWKTPEGTALKEVFLLGLQFVGLFQLPGGRVRQDSSHGCGWDGCGPATILR